MTHPDVRPASSLVTVTRPDLAPLASLMPALEHLWATRELTNGARFHRQLEADLARFLDVPALSLYANGTLALLASIRALGLTGEVITTPYSFVATSHALLWSGLTPVFVDIDPVTFNLDATKVARAITPRTSAILPVHVYGYPCDSAALALLAQQHGLKLLFDAAHAFGVRPRAGNLLCAGDLSVLSFHATKVFHTFEGGAVVCPDAATKLQLDRLKNFGFVNELRVESVGMNAKMNELQAAVGCVNLPLFEAARLRRQAVDARYRGELGEVPGLEIPLPPSVATHNFGYFPVLVKPSFSMSRDDLVQNLRARGLMVRRYFYPLITESPVYLHFPSAAPSGLPVAHRVASEVVCLPMYAELTQDEQSRVIEGVRQAGFARPRHGEAGSL